MGSELNRLITTKPADHHRNWSCSAGFFLDRGDRLSWRMNRVGAAAFRYALWPGFHQVPEVGINGRELIQG
jgi:hypothetical protein